VANSLSELRRLAVAVGRGRDSLEGALEAQVHPRELLAL
jgi:hypothetical protein